MGNCTRPATQLGILDEDQSLPSYHLLLKASTWQRDSHELFDYESPNLRRKTIEIHLSSSLIRNKTDEILEVPVADIIKQNKKSILYSNQTAMTVEQSTEIIEPTLHVNVSRGGFFSVFDKVHYIDSRTLKPVIITKEAPSVTKAPKLRN